MDWTEPTERRASRAYLATMVPLELKAIRAFKVSKENQGQTVQTAHRVFRAFLEQTGPRGTPETQDRKGFKV